jgi:hypothetical protein
MTHNSPGLLVRSVFADADGQPITSAATFLTTHESPLSERWGGWYVTGSGSAGAFEKHMGNARFTEVEGKDPQPSDPLTVAKALPKNVDASKYLTPHSDLVALLVLAHQVEAHNRMTRAAHGTLRALRDEKVMNDAFGEQTKPRVHSESTIGRIKSSCEPLVEYLLFANEPPLHGPVAGTSDFTKEFSARGLRDGRGRSLRDFDLTTRVFKYPCSYLIYSKTFDGLPDEVRQYVYHRLHEVLTDKPNSDDKTFAHLSLADRTAIAEILRDTKPALRAAWQTSDGAKQP